MRERFARWVFLMVAVALTLLGRPDAPYGHASADEESIRPASDDLSLMTEQRRAPGVRGTGEQSKPSASAPIAADVPLRGELVADAQIIELEWIDAWSWRRAEPGFSAVSARGPPTHGC